MELPRRVKYARGALDNKKPRRWRDGESEIAGNKRRYAVVTFTVKDAWSGLATLKLQRYSYVTKEWKDVASWNCNNSTAAIKKNYIEREEGVFYYKLL